MDTSICYAGGVLDVIMQCRQILQSLVAVLRKRSASFFLRLWELLRRGQCLVFSYLDSFYIMLLYFLSSSIVGFVALIIVGRKPGAPTPSNFDLFFTSVSAATVSSMSTINVEDLSRGQLVVLALLMMVGGEVFSSLVQLHMLKTGCGSKVVAEKGKEDAKVEVNNMELVEVVVMPVNVDQGSKMAVEIHLENKEEEDDNLKIRSIKLLTLVISVYVGLAHLLGFIATLSYVALADARNVLRERGIPATLFSCFVVVSTFSSGGFIPTKEGMAAFKRNTGLLVVLMPLLLTGNTMFPPVLRSILWVLKRFSRKKVPELEYLTSDRSQELRFNHLLPKRKVIFLSYTVWGFFVVQFMLFCGLEWNSSIMEGMSASQKIVAVLFQSVNSRHAGESLFDLSVISTAIIVLYLAMMYLPSYTVFLPEMEGTTKDSRMQGKVEERHEPTKLGLRKSLVMSHLACLVIFVIIVCLTERHNLSKDPLNFNLLSMTVEVVSAYGNVGFSMGYSCNQQLIPDGKCEVSWCGFVGKWSTKGKLVLIVVMLFGRLKKFNMKGGRAWKLH